MRTIVTLDIQAEHTPEVCASHKMKQIESFIIEALMRVKRA